MNAESRQLIFLNEYIHIFQLVKLTNTILNILNNSETKAHHKQISKLAICGPQVVCFKLRFQFEQPSKFKLNIQTSRNCDACIVSGGVLLSRCR